MAKARSKKLDATSDDRTRVRTSTGHGKPSGKDEKPADPILDMAHDADFVFRDGRPETKGVEEESVPAKKRIAWGDGSSGRPLPGLGYLWSNDDATDADPTVFDAKEPMDLSLDYETIKRKQAYERLSGNDSAKSPASSSVTKERSRKRRAQFEPDEEDPDDEGLEEEELQLDSMPRMEHTESLYIADFDALIKFYRQRFEDMTMKPLRKVITEWIKRLEPQRCSKYGGYDNQLPSERPEGKTPIWWPADCPYREPAHLKREHLIPLAAEIMLVHRQVDELCGKRKRPWINQLRIQAEYIVDSMPTETFSSSKGDVFNDVMKERALKEILPSLFDIASAHEDYIIQHGLFEGSGKKDPLKGKTVTWKRLPRPLRGGAQQKRKRPRQKVPVSSAPVDDPMVIEEMGDETDADESMGVPSSAISSFQASNESYETGTVIKQESPPSPRSLFSVPTAYRTRWASRSPKKELTPIFPSPLKHSMSQLQFGGIQDDVKPMMDGGAVHFHPHNAAMGANFHVMEGIAQLPVPASSPLPFQVDTGNGMCGIQHPHTLPLDGTFNNLRCPCALPTMQGTYDEVQLPFGNYAYGDVGQYMNGMDPRFGAYVTHGGFSGVPATYPC